jgi:hypothetical protein
MANTNLITFKLYFVKFISKFPHFGNVSDHAKPEKLKPSEDTIGIEVHGLRVNLIQYQFSVLIFLVCNFSFQDFTFFLNDPSKT